MTAAPPPHTQVEGVDAVIVAADRLFASAGAAALHHDAVAAAAGTDTDTVRSVYPTATDLVVAVLEYRQQQWLTGLATASTGAREPKDQILTLFNYLESCFMDDTWRGCAFINGYGELGRTTPVVAALAAEHCTSIEAHLRTLCAAADLPPFVADGLSLLVEGAKVEAAIHRTTQPARPARMTAAMLMSVYDPARHDVFI